MAQIDELKCKLTEYTVLYAGKILWGMDCDLAVIQQEIVKLEYYRQVLESLETDNTCTEQIPYPIRQKITSYLNQLSRVRNTVCRHCS
jgi:hypothetical protein